MKGGFLLQHESGRKAQVQRQDSAAEGPAAAAAASTAAVQPAGSEGAAARMQSTVQAPAARTPEQAAAGLAECLELLKGPTDERRFVGLLLVTKLLPAGDAVSIRQVHAAVGPTFLNRLLLPLMSTAPASAASAAAQEAASCALGLAVLSSFTRVPDLAASGDVVEKLPLLLKVVKAGGVGPVLAARRPAAQPSQAPPASTPPAEVTEPAADAAAVLDALECAVAAARSGAEGAAVAFDSGAVGASSAALRGCPAHATQQMSLALQLLAAVLADEGRRVEVQAGDQALFFQQLLPALARVFALPAQRPGAGTPGSGVGSAQGDEEAQELQRRQLAVQLEALHVLLLLLPLPHDAHAVHAGHAVRGTSWPADLRQGLGLLLRGRISAVQRHSALQLAAAVVDLAGPEWLLGGGARQPGASDGQAFFQLLVEVTKVETSVLLHDALAPDVPVPLSSAAAPAAGEWRAPAPRAAPPGSESGSEAGDGNHAAGAELAADLAGGTAEPSADVEPLLRVLSSEEDRRQLEAQMRREQQQAVAAAGAAGQAQPQHMQPGEFMRRVDGTHIPSDMRWEGPTEPSGARAARVLPSCFALLESCIDALADDAQRTEAMEADGAAAAAGAPLPLSPGVAERALFSLQEAVEVVLQFVEQTVAEEGQEAERGASGDVGSVVRHALLLAALRVVARFCAEAPDAFAPRLRPLLPQLLPLRMPGFGGAGAGVDLGPEQEQEVETPAEGTVFLHPLLLQVTDPSYASGHAQEQQRREQRLWLDALSAPAVLRQLAVYTRQCAASCAPAVTTAVAAAADDALLYACQLLLNILADAPAPPGASHVAEEAAEEAGQRRQRFLECGEAVSLLRELLHLAAMRPLLTEQESSPADVLAAARLLAALAALCAVLAASVAEGLQTGAATKHLELSLEDQLRQMVEEAAAGHFVASGQGRHGLWLAEEASQRVSSFTADEGAEAAGAGAGATHLPFLGPISGRAMSALCCELLAAIRVAAQLSVEGAELAGADRQLIAARSAAAADVALQDELRRLLHVAATQAAVLLRHYPPFQPRCLKDEWVRAEVAAVARGRGACSDLDAPPGLTLFLGELAEAAQM